jgi:hypothetical protein
MQGSDIFLSIVIVCILAEIGIWLMVKKGTLLKVIRKATDRRKPEDRQSFLLRLNTYKFISNEQYALLQQEYQTGKQSRSKKSETPAESNKYRPTAEQIDQAETLAIRNSGGGYLKRVKKMARLYFTIFQLTNEVNFYRKIAGVAKLENDL